jgi:formate hydrogenlyase subunit 3/multisubunit Na+/H+ antiporter MnhD subunit
LDPLSAWFVVLVLGVGAPVAAFGTWYLRAERAHGGVGRAQFWLASLLVAVTIVVTAQAALLFLVAWEVMALASYFLVVFDDRRPEVRRAGLIYLLTTHAATLLLFVLFGLWGRDTPDLTFASLGAAEHLGTTQPVLLGLGLLAFGIKAGFVPFHFWLPEAHAAAPSHVSALMSGVIIKVGVYGMLRLVTLLGAPPAWWGWAVLILGAGSGVLGVLWALAQHDLKRLLAYHSVENIGIILLGLGAGSLGLAYQLPALAALGFLGAALHTLNHALFKSLLFLGAGSVLRQAGSRDLEGLGGLARRMPLTWLAFLVGSIAIIGLPPLNGFVSEWIVFQALFAAGLSATPAALALFAVAALGLIGGLALACFAKVCGTVFLGHPRTGGAAAAVETPAAAWSPMLALALACVVIGVLPWLVLPSALRVAGFVAGAPAGVIVAATSGAVDGATRIPVVAALLIGLAGATAIARGRALRRAGWATGETWACGYSGPSARTQYSASSFAAPLVGLFGPVAGVAIHRSATAFATYPTDIVLDKVLAPAWRAVRGAGARFRLQPGRLHLYLLYIVATVCLLLLYLAVAESVP